jgi:hypothetical protein
MGSDERMLALSGTEQGGQGMSVRKQTGGEMRRGQPAEAGATLRELRGAAKTLKFYRYGAQAMNTIKFEED